MSEAARLQTIYLSGICFDFYTRTGLSIYDREFLTFCTIVANGNCEGQLIGHANGNYSVGHSADMLRAAVMLNSKENGEEKTGLALNVIDSTDKGEYTEPKSEDIEKGENITLSYRSDSEEILSVKEHFKTDDDRNFIGKNLDAETQSYIEAQIMTVTDGTKAEKSDDAAKNILADIAIMSAKGGKEAEMSEKVKEGLKKGISGDQMLAAVLLCVPYNGFPRTLNATAAINAALAESTEETKEEPESITDKNYLSMTIGSKTVLLNGEEQSIDVSPVIQNGRTLLPIRAIIETFGGTANWAADDKTTAITYGENVVTLTVGSTRAFVNNKETEIGTAPIIIDGRTFLPVRFLSENLGLDVDWNEETKTVTITQTTQPEYDITPIDDIFGLNMINPVSPKFTGVSFLNFLTTSEETDGAPSLGVVTFEPCTRTDWHSHEGGQILLVTEGTGVLGFEGETPKLMLPGDVYYIEPNVKHFHSAADKSWFSHIALSVNPGTSTNWYDKVTDEEYMTAVAQAMRSSAGTHNSDETIFPKGEAMTGDNFTGNINTKVIVEHEDVFNCPVVRSWAMDKNSSAKNLSGTDGKTVIAVLKGSGTFETAESSQNIQTGSLVIVEADTDYTISTFDENLEFISMNTKE